MADRRRTLRDGTNVTRKQLVIEGRRLVVFDLGHDGEDRSLAQEHQELFLGHLLGVQWHTWFKTVAQRAHDGRDQAHRRRLSNDERVRRLRIAHGIPIGSVPNDPTGGDFVPPTPGVGGRLGAPVLRKTVRKG